ncbi:putative chromate transport protein [Limihaloglobus sulfuriphilus]|uniref:Putative chromate transport protein n=1 Tax=Limihaloglobus sulfuriphilus TaxID=1851148 RepID=A0A1Q2MGV1_9BACT|nr:chromate transporter [Limihaloglobus sulfuriphilus]AQQ71910.1 putative chromate transport protein [Limihaloglobus sulfuriphilus]
MSKKAKEKNSKTSRRGTPGESLRLFAAFFKIGLFTIGGGYVMLPMLRRELVENRGWLTDEDVLNYFAIGQSTPGVIAVNTATFVGYRRAGVAGALFASAGMLAPSLIIIVTIAAFFSHFQDIPIVQKAFAGMRIGVSMLLVYIVITLWRKAVKDIFGAVLGIGAFVSVLVFGISPIPVVITAAVAGLLYGRLQEAKPR